MTGPGPDDGFEPRDLLHPAVVPLAAPPGAHQSVLRRARRRRARSAATLAGAVAVVVGLVVAVPVLTLGGSTGTPVADAPSTPATTPTTATGPTTVTPPPAADATTDAPTTTDGAPTTTATDPVVASEDGRATGPVPPGFGPASVTFVSTTDGWTLGQAPCAQQPCTSVARTADGGRTWVGTAAPRTGPVRGRTGVDEVRFGDTRDGWAFGGELWSTHDGTTWDPVALPAGTAVVSLAADGTRAAAAYATCGTDGTCTSSTLRVAASAGDDFTVLPGAATLDGRADVALQGGTVWATSVVAGAVELARGSTDGTVPVARLATPCAAGTTAARLAVGSGTRLDLVCQGADGRVTVHPSDDGGTTWAAGTVVALGGPLEAAALSPAGVLLVSGGAGGVQRIAGSTTTTVLAASASFVGWTTATQAVALPSNPTAGLLYLTRDGAGTWEQRPVRS